jgi:hypothetical protein
MHLVAGGTAFGCGFMDKLLCEFSFIMAIVTNLAVRFTHYVFPKTIMRRVAIDTFTGHRQGLMDILLANHTFRIGMALQAERFSILLGSQSV